MRPRFLLMCAIALVGAIFSIHLTGCSLVGLGIGALVDNAQTTRYKPRAPEQLYKVSLNTPIQLQLRDSTRWAGRFEGLRETSDGKRLVLGHPKDQFDLIVPDSIVSVGVAAPKHGKIVGFVVGLTADAIIVAGVAAGLSDSGCSGGGIGYSGGSYVRELPAGAQFTPIPAHR